MADDLRARYDDRIQNGYAKYRDYLNQSIAKFNWVPKDGDDERTQKNKMIDDLRPLRDRIDKFIQFLQS